MRMVAVMKVGSGEPHGRQIRIGVIVVTIAEQQCMWIQIADRASAQRLALALRHADGLRSRCDAGVVPGVLARTPLTNSSLLSHVSQPVLWAVPVVPLVVPLPSKRSPLL